MKKYLLLYLMFLWPFFASADAVEIGGIFYNLNTEDKTAEVTSNPNGYIGVIVIPEEITYGDIKYNVTSIGGWAFSGCSSLISVTIPNSIDSIEIGAFSGCTSLTSVTIPENVKSIDVAAFNYCTSLVNVSIPNSVIYVGSNAFTETPWLKNQPDGLIYVGKAAYRYKGSSDNKSVVIKDGTTCISGLAFEDCSGLKSIIIPNSVTSIGIHAFSGCSSLTSLIIPAGVTSLGSSDIGGCINLTSLALLADSNVDYLINFLSFIDENILSNLTVYVPASTLSKYDSGSYCQKPHFSALGAFNGYCGENVKYSFDTYTGVLKISGVGEMWSLPCDSYKSWIKSVEIENGVTSIAERAFEGYSSLISITIPNSVEYIGNWAFDNTPWYANQPDGLFCAGKVVYKYKGEMPENTSINIKDGIVSISPSAFSGCSGLASISIPNSVTTIGKDAFVNCSNLNSISIPINITQIEDYTFSGCSSLISISLPNDLTSIGHSAFYGCSSLTSITIPSSVELIGNEAFGGCSVLSSIILPSNVKSIGKYTFSGCSGLTSIVVPEGVTSIGEYAFCGCSGLTSIVIPESVTSIGEYAFYGCSGLSSLLIPDGVYSIRKYAFSGCTDLTSVTFPTNEYYTNIEDGLFMNCSSLTSIFIPSNITYIGNNSFSKCNQLNSIIVDENNSVFDSRNSCNAIVRTENNELVLGCNNTIIPEDITSIAGNAFSECYNLSSISIPSGVISIDDFSFNDCIGLSSITVDEANPVYDSRDNCNAIIETATNTLILASINTVIPQGVKLSNWNAYKNCISLTLPDGLKTINYDMFRYCINLESICIPGSVTTIDEHAFMDCTKLKNVVFKEGSDTLSFCAYSYYYIDWFLGCPIDSIFIGRNIKYDISYNNHGNNSLSPFKDNEFLKKVVYGDNVSIVADGMFSGCSNLSFLVLPEKLDYLGRNAFYGCENLSSVSIPEGLSSIEENAFGRCKNISNIEIPGSVEEIESNAFYGCESITSVTIPASVTSIGKGAFYGCISLSDLKIDDGDQPLSIREESYSKAFEGCPITNLYLGRNIINNSYNYIYSSLASFTTPFDLTIGKTVTELAGGTFAECEKIKTITFEEGVDTLRLINDHNGYSTIMPFENTPIDSIYLGRVIVGYDNYYPEETTIPFANVGSSFALRIGEIINEIGERACSGWKISRLYIPENVSVIGLDAFSNCDPLSSVVIEDGANSLEFLEGSRFKGCQLKNLYLGRNLVYTDSSSPFRNNKEALTTLTIGNHVTEIGDYEFVGMKSLKNIVFPGSLKKIGKQAFYGCEALTTISIPQCVTEICEDAFNLTPSLTSFIIEDGTENLAINNCFLNSSLSEVYLGRNITYPEHNSPFSLLESLMSLKIGEKVTTIGNYAFSGCQNLQEVTSYAVNVPTTGVNVFTESYIVNATLHVLPTAYENYKIKAPWNLFKNMLEIEGEEITISSAQQVPYYSDKNLDFRYVKSLKAYVATGYDKSTGTIWLSRINEVPAETGFLLVGEEGTYVIPISEKSSDCYYKNMFKGTLEGTTLYTTDGDYTNYYLSKGDAGVGFYKVTNENGVSIKANRAYLPILTDIPANGAEGDAEVIKISAAKQVPYYTSKNIDFTSLDAQGVKAYTATGYNYSTGVIWLTRVKKVPAQTGILVMADKEGVYNVPTTMVQSVYENMFTGSETAQTIYTTETDGDITYINYYLSNGESGVGVYKVTKEEGVKMGANRCYLPIPKRDAASGARGKSGESSFCKMILSDESNDDVIAIPVFGGMNGDDEGTTGISEAPQRVGEPDVYYNLQGQRVNNPTMGLYIRNGKKVIVR